MQNQPGIQACNNIVEHDPPAPAEMPVNPVSREWLQYIKKTKQEKTQENGHRMERCCGEGDQLADDFVDDHRTGIDAIKNFFRCPAADNADKEKNSDKGKKRLQIHATDTQPDEHTNR